MAFVVAVRPENILLRVNGDASDAVNSFPARVIEGHFHGTQTIYAIETLGQRLERDALAVAWEAKGVLPAPTAEGGAALLPDGVRDLAKSLPTHVIAQIKVATRTRVDFGLALYFPATQSFTGEPVLPGTRSGATTSLIFFRSAGSIWLSPAITAVASTLSASARL